MAKTNNIIELNGRRYDASTGELIDSTRVSAPEKNVPVKQHATHRGFVVDGIVKQGTLSKTKLAPIPVKPAPPAKLVQKTAAHKPKPIVAHKPEHSQTLMRHAVKAPKVTPKKSLKVQVPNDLIKKQPATLTVKPKLSSDFVDEQRAERAKQVPRSNTVARFHKPTRPVRAAASPLATPQRRSYTQSTAARNTDGIARTQSYASPSPFERAIAHAHSHEQVTPKTALHQKTRRQAKKRFKIAGISAAILTVLLLGGFIALQNKVSIELQLASAKAGFHATVPGNKPSGFAVKDLTYSPGTVTIGLRSESQAFDIVQKTSNWDSQTLLENFVATSGTPYQTYQAGGRTVYIYNDGSATWVNGGIWYQLEGNAHLTSDQVVNLAASM